MPNPYVEHCKEVAASIDVEELSIRALGPLGGSGGSFAFRRLGVLPLLSTELDVQYAGLKLPLEDQRDSASRLRNETALIGFLCLTSPQTQSYVPNFMNLISVEGSSATGILTEDVSATGLHPVKSVAASSAVRDILKAPFNHLIDPEKALVEDECNQTLAFVVNGNEKLLDFTPYPINQHLLTSNARYAEVLDETVASIPSMTVTVPAHSPLGQALSSQY